MANLGMPRLSIIIVTYNSTAYIDPCLRSLVEQRPNVDHEILVVDNASTDGTAQVLRGHPGVRVASNRENVGYSAANNQGAAMASGRILFFLNPDTVLLEPDTLQKLVSALERPGVGMVGPQLVNPDGTVQPSCAGHPGVLRAVLVSTGLHRLLPDRVRARAAPDLWSHDAARDAAWLRGAALAIPASVFADVGGFWPLMYASDEDLALRLQRRGLRVRYEPSARVAHIGSHSVFQRWTDVERAARIVDAEVELLRAHYSPPRAAAIRAISGAGLALRALLHRALGRPGRALVHRSMARVYLGSRAR
jgi:GT2 family glycosyltransferase